MGNKVSRYCASLIGSEIFSAEKRKRDSSDDEDDEYDRGRNKRRKLRGITVPKYIYKELFEQGVYSDIRIVACNKEWNLHKVHLKQCPYFASMLSGAWKEANQDVINIEIVDPYITVEALDATFSSLYLDEIELDKKNIVPILAAASHFRMDKLAERCGDIMIENTNHHVVLKYYNISEQYGLKKLKEATFDYILTHIVTNQALCPLYPQISIELMTSIVAHPDLVVQHSDQNVYMLVIRWLYKCVTQCRKKHVADADVVRYFCDRTGPEFLLTEEGEKYQPTFKALNLPAILITHVSVRMLLRNNVVPHAWINSAVMAIYMDCLKSNEGTDAGPTEEDMGEIDVRGIRTGRLLKSFGTWRTVGLHNGLVLTWSFSNNLLEVTRMRGGSNPDLITNIPTRRIICKVSFIRRGRPRLTIPAQVLNLDLGQKIEVYRLPEQVQFPIVLQMRLLLTSTVVSQPEFSPALIIQ